jgi:PhoH-like ATPase
MHDPTSLFRFEEHDIFLPMMTLEELDNEQEGHVRSRAQCAPGEPLPRRDRRLDAKADIKRRHPARAPAREATGRLFLQTEAINGRCRRSLPSGKADNQILGGGECTCRSAPQAAGDPGVQGHQHAHQGARAGARRRGLLQRQGAGGHRPALHRRARSCRRTSGTPTARTWSPGSRNGHTYYRVRGPLCPDLLVNEFVFRRATTPLHALVKEVRAARRRS